MRYHNAIASHSHEYCPAAEMAARQALPRLRSSELLSGSREAIIEHGQDLYRLRLTSNGKLILTK